MSFLLNSIHVGRSQYLVCWLKITSLTEILHFKMATASSVVNISRDATEPENVLTPQGSQGAVLEPRAILRLQCNAADSAGLNSGATNQSPITNSQYEV